MSSGPDVTGFPFRLVREGVLMTPDVNDPLEGEGVLNPAAGWSGGQLYLLPRMVAAAGERLNVKLEAVDSCGLLPTASTSAPTPEPWARRAAR